MEMKLFTHRYRIGFFTNGQCWRFKYHLDKYFSGNVFWHTFWRLYFVYERKTFTYSESRHVA